MEKTNFTDWKTDAYINKANFQRYVSGKGENI